MNELLFFLFSPLMKYVYFLVGAFVVLSYVVKAYREFNKVDNQWQHCFDDFKFSAVDFYAIVEKEIKKRKPPKVSMKRISYPEAGITSHNRIYLEVTFQNIRFIICAAPYGSGFFVSWRSGTTITFFQDMLTRLPFVGRYISNAYDSRTYFQLDTEGMFMNTVKNAVMEAIDEVTNQKGIRSLTEEEKRSHKPSRNAPIFH